MLNSQSANILIVDDNEQNLSVLADMLSIRDYRVMTAINGQDALEAVQKYPFDIILLDIQMPYMNGYEVCRHLKTNEHSQEIPVVFISALNEVEDIVRGFEAGGVDYIAKPFQIREVLARVENHLMIARQRQALIEKNAEIESLRQRDAEAFHMLNTMRDQFIYAATHDMKNPLFIISAYMGMLNQAPQVAQNAELLGYVQGIGDGVGKMQRLITVMLDLAQLQTGANLRLFRHHLLPIAEASVKRMLILAQQNNLTLQMQVQRAGAYHTLMDANQMEQVLDNLLGNAIKYTPQGGSVTLTLDYDEQSIHLAVCDTGIGIPEDALPRLFDAFYRVKTPKHGAINGTGLGLAIVKTILDLHQARIEVQSQPDKGSCFHVYLPIVQSE